MTVWNDLAGNLPQSLHQRNLPACKKPDKSTLIRADGCAPPAAAGPKPVFRCVNDAPGMANDNTPDQLNRNLIAAIWKEGIVSAPGVQDAFRHVARHVFLPDFPLETVYSDVAIPLKFDHAGFVVASSSQPTMMAIMLDQMRLKPGDNVLEIGTATGYNAAIMAHIVGQHGYITSIEIDKDLAQQAEKNLSRARFSDVRVVNADGAYGYLPRAAYDHIIATAGVWDIPPAWIRQLKDTGCLLAPIWVNGMQVSALFNQEEGGTLLSTDNRGCSFVYVRGEEAVPDMRRQIGSTSLYIVSNAAPHIDTVRLQMLLSDDYEFVNIEPRLNAAEYWTGAQASILLNMPHNASFFLYHVNEDMQAYGISGRGIGILMPGSAVFAPYEERGVAHVFGGSEALMLLQSLLSKWMAQGRPTMKQLRLRLYPRNGVPPEITTGILYERKYHWLHVWQAE